MNVETIARIRLYKRTVKWTNKEALIIESILIFLSKELKTIDYLKKFGFSKKIINDFFKPFFAGILLTVVIGYAWRKGFFDKFR